MSTLPEKPQRNLDEVMERVNAHLNSAGSPFSEQAFEKLTEQIEAYSVELVTESVKRAGRHQAEGVSSSDVRHASQYLFSSTSHKIYRHAGTFGGMFFGSALSNLLSIATTGQYGLNGIILTFGLAIIGTSFITVHTLKD